MKKKSDNLKGGGFLTHTVDVKNKKYDKVRLWDVRKDL